MKYILSCGLMLPVYTDWINLVKVDRLGFAPRALLCSGHGCKPPNMVPMTGNVLCVVMFEIQPFLHQQKVSFTKISLMYASDILNITEFHQRMSKHLRWIDNLQG